MAWCIRECCQHMHMLLHRHARPLPACSSAGRMKPERAVLVQRAIEGIPSVGLPLSGVAVTLRTEPATAV